jgi:predicted CoA-binding protein
LIKIQQMITHAQIDAFFSVDTIAVAGVSRNPKKFGNIIFRTISDKKKYRVLPVNPAVDEIEGQKCYRDIASLPDAVHSIVLVTPKNKTAEALKSAIAKGIKNIWIQQHTETPEAIRIASESGLNVIFKKCIIMFTEPVAGFHRFHRNMMKFFGRLPK